MRTGHASGRGWLKILKTVEEQQDAVASRTAETMALYEAVKSWQVGTIVERRGRKLGQRLERH